MNIHPLHTSLHTHHKVTNNVYGLTCTPEATVTWETSYQRPDKNSDVLANDSWKTETQRPFRSLVKLRFKKKKKKNLDSADGIKRGWGSAELTEKPWLWLSLPNVDYVFPPLGRIGALDLFCLRWQMATAFDSGNTEYFHHPESSMGQNCSRYKLSYRKIKYIPGTPSLIDWHCYLLYI